MQRIVTFKKVKGILIEESQGALFASFTLKLCLVLFRASLYRTLRVMKTLNFYD